ncbi:MAG: response regulator [Thermoplasmata archaeon]|nr:response regulator [Thermoplasmata archaeon]
MLIEDNEAHAELTVNALEQAHNVNKIITMRNGSEAIDYLKSHGQWEDQTNRPMPTLILMDLKMPVLDGKQALAAIKEDADLKSIPVVMLTSSMLDSDIKECYEKGANSYIVKPVSFGKFVEIVKSIPLYWMLVNKLPGGY